MTDAVTRTLTEDLLVSTLDDWAYVSWAIPSVLGHGEYRGDLIRASTLGLIAELLFQELVIPGDLVDGIHVPWAGPSNVALERIALEWINVWGDAIPSPGAIAWLACTAKGEKIARAVLAREAGDSSPEQSFAPAD